MRHKQLHSILHEVIKERKNSLSKSKNTSLNNNYFKQLIKEWTNITGTVLEIIDKKQDEITNGLEPEPAMTLGVFQADINLAMQAKDASDKK